MKKSIVLSTWKHGVESNRKAWEIISKNGLAIDAVEQGVMVAEADPEVNSVGYGGIPDSEGNVTTDACIMDHLGNCGAVAFLRNIKHTISVARKVMEESPHILLVGDGALKFALKKGFKEENMITEKAKVKWAEWKKKQEHDEMFIDLHNHDTIGMIALDSKNNLSGSCTTSGLACKQYGRVGDSPIIGAGLYVDNKYGAACATGKGEAVMEMSGSFLIVELMRQGKSPQKACELAVERIIEKHKNPPFQVGFLAINKDGEYGAYAVRENFQYAVNNQKEEKLINCQYPR